MEEVAGAIPVPEEPRVRSLTILAVQALCDSIVARNTAATRTATPPCTKSPQIPSELVLHILTQLKKSHKYDPQRHFADWVKEGTQDLTFKRPTFKGWEVTDDVVDLFCAHSWPSGCSNTLRSVTLSDCSVTDAGFAALLAKCSHIEEIHLQWCDPITDRSLQRIGKGKVIVKFALFVCCDIDISLSAVILNQ